MNGKTASEEAIETCTRDNFSIYHSSSRMCSSQRKNIALQVELVRKMKIMSLSLHSKHFQSGSFVVNIVTG